MESNNLDENSMDSMLGLVDLPVEIILQILQYLEVKFIVNVLAEVSQLFRDLAEDEATWKIRIQRRWPGQYPALPPDNSFDWTRACIAREEETVNWSNSGEKMLSCKNNCAHYASVNTVLVMDDVVVSGSRDRSIHLWPTKPDQEGNFRPIAKCPDAHLGWVWSLSQNDDLLISGAWDSRIKFWKLSSCGISEARREARLKTAVLTTDICQSRIAAGTFDNKVVQFDIREASRKMVVFKSHTKPVLQVRITPTRVLSLSEDSTLAVHDRVAGKRLKKVLLPSTSSAFQSGQRSFPLSMDWLDNMLYIGDSTGSIHLIDTTHDNFEVVDTYHTGDNGRVTSLACGYGSVLSCSSTGMVRIYQPSRRLQSMSSIKVSHTGQLTSLSYRNNVLAVAASDNTINIWTRPHHN